MGANPELPSRQGESALLLVLLVAQTELSRMH